MKILVTGATGYLGRAVVAACRRAGHDTLAFSRTASRAGLPGETCDGDIRDPSAVAHAVSSCDAVCHSAALVSLWRPRREEFDEVNVGGLRNVVRAARASGISRIVYTSSFLALPPGGTGEPGQWNDYQRTKVLADLDAARAVSEGVPLLRLYPGVMFGPGTMTEGNLVGREIADHLAGRLPGLIGADRVWSFAWVDDVAAAHVAALERGRPEARYCLGGENARQMAMFEVVRQVTGRKLPWRIPAAVAVALGAAEEARAAFTGRPPRLTVGTVEILTRDWPLDSSLAIQELGYRVTPLADGVRRLLSNVAQEEER